MEISKIERARIIFGEIEIKEIYIKLLQSHVIIDMRRDEYMERTNSNYAAKFHNLDNDDVNYQINLLLSDIKSLKVELETL